ncbi:hypothetical protein SDC9_98064 [bioreactor metagenome]|uniref:Uncharacterized protein n=1 Tax=bioreactor metagenome TaxID=1076179 RepID=A0A645AED5_9ZZZZ
MNILQKTHDLVRHFFNSGQHALSKGDAHNIPRAAKPGPYVCHGLGHFFCLIHVVDAAYIGNIFLQVGGVVEQELDKAHGFIRTEGLFQLVGFLDAQGVAKFALDLFQYGVHAQHVAALVRELEAQFFLGAAHASKKGLVLGASLAAAHGGLQHAEHGHLLLGGDARGLGVGPQGGKCCAHFHACGFENLHGIGGAAGELLHPLGAAHFVRLLLIDAVHGAHVSGDGGGVCLGALGKSGRGHGKCAQFLAFKSGNSRLNVVGRPHDLGGAAPILHGELLGRGLQVGQGILPRAKAAHFANCPVEVHGGVDHLVQAHASAGSGKCPGLDALKILAHAAACAVNGFLEAKNFCTALIGHADGEHEFLQCRHNLSFEGLGNAVSYSNCHLFPVIFFQPQGFTHALLAGFHLRKPAARNGQHLPQRVVCQRGGMGFYFPTMIFTSGMYSSSNAPTNCTPKPGRSTISRKASLLSSSTERMRKLRAGATLLMWVSSLMYLL